MGPNGFRSLLNKAEHVLEPPRASHWRQFLQRGPSWRVTSAQQNTGPEGSEKRRNSSAVQLQAQGLWQRVDRSNCRWRAAPAITRGWPTTDHKEERGTDFQGPSLQPQASNLEDGADQPEGHARQREQLDDINRTQAREPQELQAVLLDPGPERVWVWDSCADQGHDRCFAERASEEFNAKVTVDN